MQALRGVDLEICTRASSSCCSARRAAASRRCSTSSAGSTCRPRARRFWRDHDLAARRRGELTRYRREHVGFVFQFYNLIPSLTARENVALVTEIAPHPMRAERGARRWSASARAREPLSRRSSRAASSSAWRSRAPIAKRPDVLLCDEPTGALDYETGKVVLEVLERVNRELGTTTVVITHNAAIAGMADRVLHLADGRIAQRRAQRAQATPEELPGEARSTASCCATCGSMRGQVVTIALVVGVRRSPAFAGSMRDATTRCVERARRRYYAAARFARRLRRRQARAARARAADRARSPASADAETRGRAATSRSTSRTSPSR